MCFAWDNSNSDSYERFDEFAPGDKLKIDNARKAMVLSYSFRELGQEGLSNASLWNTPIVIRSRMMNLVPGGFPAILAAFLRRILLGPSGLAIAGMTVALPTGPRLLFGVLGNALSDGDGFRWTLQMNELEQQSESTCPATNRTSTELQREFAFSIVCC